MTRTRAEALVLVNWKGIFYERYLLDRHVTALEGANGAGKTTVMIAAYIVLLPDMSRLRFTNLGETGATGGDKGIWGRLGEAGRPSYAVLDFTVGEGHRLIAGVHLERKGEPSVEPTPFLVTGLGNDVRLQDLLLVTQEESEVVPEIHELRECAARLGGRLQVFNSARDYFAALFDHGVTPLRLGTDEERNKLNEMLRTSMTGGISRTLTSELRSFLLKEDGGLADVLQRMKANLDACRRTRTEVKESRRLEQEIGGVFEAGQTMFAAAFLATRERAAEHERRVAEAEAVRVAAQEAQTTADEVLARTTAELATVEGRRQETEQRLEAARSWAGRMRDALAVAGELTRCQEALDTAVAAATAAEATRADAAATRDRRRTDLQKAQGTYERAAAGLADIQSGIQELHRNAGAYHQAVRRLREAEGLLGVESLAIPEFDEHLARARSELGVVDRERREATTRLADADEHRRSHAEVMAALRSLVGGEASVADAHRLAIDALRGHRDRVALAQRAASLGSELEESCRVAEHQARVRAQANKLGVVLTADPAGLVVRTLLDHLETERAEHEAKERAARSDFATAERNRRDLEARRRELTAREPKWRDYDIRAKRLGAHWGSQVADRTALDEARSSIASEYAGVRQAEAGVQREQEDLVREARELVTASGPFHADLLRLKDQLGADLLAGAFDDVALHEAGVLEARLGPLARALVVDDPQSAARTIRSRPASLPDVMLVAREASLEALTKSPPPAEVASQDVVVVEGLALRVSRVPAQPVLGRRAREAKAAELRALAEAKSREMEDLRTKRRLLERLMADGEALLAGHMIWLSGDPTPELVEVRRKIAETDLQMTALRNTAAMHGESARALLPRIGGLRDLLAEAILLDPPDHGERARFLREQHRLALAAQAEVNRASCFVEIVEEHLAFLRTPPLADEDLSKLRAHGALLLKQRERLNDAVEALEYVRGHAEALAWSESPKRLANEQALVPALAAQLAEAKASQTVAELATRDADDHYDKATSTWHDADGRVRVTKQEHFATLARFEAIGISAPTEIALRAADAEVTRIEREQSAQRSRQDELLSTKGSQDTARKEALKRTQEAEEKLTGERQQAEPAVARWDRLQERATKHELLAAVLTDNKNDLGIVRGHVNLVQKAGEQRELMLERLRSAQGGSALLADIKVLRDTSDAKFSDAHLDLWLTVRDWLRRRLPAQVADVADPREALLRLRDQLTNLEDRLLRQEHDLRGASENVARGIDVQIRNARGQVSRLNRNLEGVSFGTIQGIRVRLHSIEKMEQVLRALREGEAQQLLFQADMPIEEALDEIFRRYGGGRTGGQRLLDYREYVHLQVEIRRKAGTDWENANPTRLSTGEAIGVGAALMMVVLTEWERDATLLRGKRTHGSLRFLFLDEANRLSHDNLGVLFDLCQTLDLQLLIAAPEVARAEGNTTYRLVRRTTADGREEVLVSGRRTRPAP